jgi:hypothetical protein
MKPLLLWIAVPLLLLGAVMLIAGIGASSLWIAVTATAWRWHGYPAELAARCRAGR